MDGNTKFFKNISFTFLMIFILFSFICKVTPKNFVEIPFKRRLEINSTLNTKEIIKELEMNIVYCILQMGTPPQNILLNPKMDIYYSFVFSDDPLINNETIPSNGTSGRPSIEFNCTKSSSYKYIKDIKNAIYGYQVAYLMEETFIYNNQKIENLPIIQAIEYSYGTSVPFDSGYIGFGPRNYSGIVKLESNLIYNLKEKNIIDSYDFFFEYENENDGKIIIGGNPYEYNNKKYPNINNEYAKIPSSGAFIFWGFEVNHVYYNNKEIFNVTQGSTKSKIKLESGIIGFSGNVKKILDDDIFHNLIKEGICEEISDNNLASTYVCKTDQLDKSIFPIIYLYNMEINKNFTIDLRKMFFDYENKSYFLIHFRFDYTFELGLPFIRNNVFFMNQDKKAIGALTDNISEEEKPKENKSKSISYKILFIIAVIFAILVSTLLLFLLYRTCKRIPKRRKGIELIDDNYDYVSFNKPNKNNTNIEDK